MGDFSSTKTSLYLEDEEMYILPETKRFDSEE